MDVGQLGFDLRSGQIVGQQVRHVAGLVRSVGAAVRLHDPHDVLVIDLVQRIAVQLRAHTLEDARLCWRGLAIPLSKAARLVLHVLAE